tara:strand:- start:125 stop:571 length:447 start_codon:yes stop_codon:yes gene_type:complete
MPLEGLGNVKKAINQIEVNANRDIKAMYFLGLRVIIMATPVDEGRVRNNWFLTVGSASGSSGRAKDKGGNGSMSSLSDIPSWILNKEIFFTNNIPYIETLEYGGYPNPSKGKKTTSGYSNQLRPFKSPKGWVRATLINMADKIRAFSK